MAEKRKPIPSPPTDKIVNGDEVKCIGVFGFIYEILDCITIKKHQLLKLRKLLKTSTSNNLACKIIEDIDNRTLLFRDRKSKKQS